MIPFDTVSPGIRPAEHRNKTAEEGARERALRAECGAWGDRLSGLAAEAFVLIARANKAAGGACPVHRADIASAIAVTPEGADRIVGRLVEIGAVERMERLKQAPLFRAMMEPPASPPSVAQKGERPPTSPLTRKSTGTTDAKLRAGLVGLRNHEEPATLDLRAGIVGANPRR